MECGCGWCRVGVSSGNGGNSVGSRLPPELEGDERLKNIEPRMVEMIMNEVCVCLCVYVCMTVLMFLT